MKSTDWLMLAQRLNAIAQSGLTYGENAYDLERYEEIRAISLRMLADLSDAPIETIVKLLPAEVGYQTPKVDIRAVVLNEQDQILMVQEKIDQNRWSLPGGWADVGYTPFEVAQKEVWEETGLEVKAVRLLAVFDKKKHQHPPQIWYVYKFFVLCTVTGGSLLADTTETAEVSWMDKTTLASLPLSTDRVTLAQLETVWHLAENPSLPALCD